MQTKKNTYLCRISNYKSFHSSTMSTTNPTGDVANQILQYNEEFEAIYNIIVHHRSRALKTVHHESLSMIWEVGAYVNSRLEQAAWGEGVVRLLADFLRSRNPKAKGWSYRTIYKMVKFYRIYSTESFGNLVNSYGLSSYPMQIETGQQTNELVPIELALIQPDSFVQRSRHGGCTFCHESQHVAHHGCPVQGATSGRQRHPTQSCGVLSIP